MVLYLSGPITGIENYRDRFQRAKTDLIAKGHVPLNPAELPDGLLKYEDYIQIGIQELDVSEGIVMLPGWKKSNGAKMELLYALCHRKTIFFGTKNVPFNLP